MDKVQASTLTSKGQLTVPVEIRRHLGLREGDQVEFVAEDGRMTLRRARSAADPFLSYVGALPAFATRQSVLAWLRELRDGQ